MMSQTTVEQATNLILDRPDLDLANPLQQILGSQPSLERLELAAAALSDLRILDPVIGALLHDPTGMQADETPPKVTVNLDAEGNRIESLHAIPLAEGYGWNARLHIWLGELMLTEDTHDHKVSFGSAVLLDGFRDTPFIRVPYGQGRQMFRYINDDNNSEPVEEVTLRPLEPRLVRPGEVYSLDRSAIHSANVHPDGVAATVVVRSDRLSASNGYTEGPRTGSAPWTEGIEMTATLTRLRAGLRNR
jgi:hypothetical protein